MSENQDRRNRELTQYDSMTTEALEEILRLDTEAPEGQESDTELLLYVMEVLANRRNTNNTGKTAQEAWEAFQQQYLPTEEECPEHTEETKKPVKMPQYWLRRMIAAAAVVALLVGLPVAVSAFGWEDIWNAVAKWAKETFSFVSGEQTETSEPATADNLQYTSLRDVLPTEDGTNKLVPSLIPQGYELDDITIYENPERKTYIAFYRNGEKTMMITVQSYLNGDAEKVEINEELLEIYKASDIECYIFNNNQQLRAVWISGSYECYISGELTVEEIKTMIDSIGKG